MQQALLILWQDDQNGLPICATRMTTAFANPRSRDSVALKEAAARTAAMFGYGAQVPDV
ncbi:MAG: hypothetical protein Devi2KO_35050 [Devosia indica]